MKKFLRPNLIKLAENLDRPLYVVGGFVRNFLLGEKVFGDVDLASPMCAKEFSNKVKEFGFSVLAEYKHTGTVLFTDGIDKYEFTSFRIESYLSGGFHSPDKVFFTDDIALDAKRRDFTCNAVYYDIKKGEVVDPLGGVQDIKNKVLKTTVSAKEVFSHDGLRLMRLARFCGELNFTIDEHTFEGAKLYAKNIKDIAVERVYAELKMILASDKKYPFSNPSGHYEGLKVLEKTGVLDEIMPELTLGRGMKQREDYHNYDVLEHSLRCVLYAPKTVRLSALLHDVGKPFAMLNYGKYHAHEKFGEKIAKTILQRLKVDSQSIKETCFLVSAHMYDVKDNMRQTKIRRIIVKGAKYFDKLMDLMVADYRASKDYKDTPYTVKKWKKIFSDMHTDGTPFTLGDLKISSKELTELGYSGIELGKQLKKLFELCVDNPSFNEYSKLRKISEKNKHP